MDLDASVEHRPGGQETGQIIRFSGGRVASQGTPAPTTGDSGPRPPIGPAVVSFDRRELQTILNVYGRRVAEGEWRDYGLNFGKDEARFDIHRRASEQPLYSVVKNPALAERGGLFQVVAAGGLIMKRGNDLSMVLRVLEKKPKLESI